MIDGPIRRTVKWAARVVYLRALDLQRRFRIWRGERPFELGGACGGCAKCCEEPAIQVSTLLFKMPFARHGFVAWQRFVNGFEPTRSDETSGVLFFRCTHFDPQTRRCDSYGSRPGMCRDYPRMQLYHPNPELFEGCGYRAIAPNASGLLKVLQDQPMTDEQREKLKDGLRLR